MHKKKNNKYEKYGFAKNKVAYILLICFLIALFGAFITKDSPKVIGSTTVKAEEKVLEVKPEIKEVKEEVKAQPQDPYSVAINSMMTLIPILVVGAIVLIIISYFGNN